MKREDTTLYQEIEALSSLVKPIHIDDPEERVECTIYEIPDLQSSLDWDVPTRGFKIIEKEYNIVSGEKPTPEKKHFCV